MKTENLIGVSEKELEETFIALGEKPYRVGQTMNWVYHYGIYDFNEMTNLSKATRAQLAKKFHISLPSIKEKTQSRDGTIKYLIQFEDGECIESVWMPSGDRKTLSASPARWDVD